MKKMLNLLLFLVISAHAVFAQAQAKPATTSKAPVTVCYFHPTERCPIDQSIEENTRKLMQSDFAKNIKDGTVKLLVLNTDDKANAKMFFITVANIYFLVLSFKIPFRGEQPDYLFHQPSSKFFNLAFFYHFIFYLVQHSVYKIFAFWCAVQF